MEYQGYSINDKESLLLYDILQEIKAINKALAKINADMAKIEKELPLPFEPESEDEILFPVMDEAKAARTERAVKAITATRAKTKPATSKKQSAKKKTTSRK